MKTLNIAIELEENLVRLYQQTSGEFRMKLQNELQLWFELQLQSEIQKTNDEPWLNFLDNIEQYAVDTGINDLSLNHDHYLYGTQKRS